MSKPVDLNELRKKAAEDAEQKKTMSTAEKLKKAGLAKDPLQAALDREKEKELEAAKAEEEALKERREDEDTEYEYRDEKTGLNIGDSLARRFKHAEEIIAEKREADMTAELEGDIADVDQEAATPTPKVQKADPIQSVDEDDEDGTDFSLDVKPTEKRSISDYTLVDEKTSVKETTMSETIETKVEQKEKEALADAATTTQSDLIIDDEDLKEIENDVDEEDGPTEEEKKEAEEREAKQKEALEGLKGEIKNRLEKDIVAKRAKDGSVKISSKVVSLSDALKANKKNKKAVQYPLFSAGRNVTMAQYAGQDIEALNAGNTGKNRFEALKERFLIIYDHIVDENKPEFEAWLKKLSFFDLEHVYMAVYKACFIGANYIPYSCTHKDCEKLFLSDNIDIMEMVKFTDDEAKERFNAIFNNTCVETVLESKLYETKVVDISDTFAIGFREPSVYNTLFENSVLDDKFVNKYAKLLTTMVYIDQIYMITEDGEYLPIGYQTFKSNPKKSAKMRIATYARILKELSSDEFARVQGEIEKINTLGDRVTYQLPETVCPDCGSKIEATPQTAQQLLFARHRLNLLAQS